MRELLTQASEIDRTAKAWNNERPMSLGIAFKGPEGIVLAADSRVTIMALTQLQPLPPNAPAGQQPVPQMQLPSAYDNATKLLRVAGQDNVGAVTYGVGAIGRQSPRTAHSFIPEFEAQLDDSDRLPVEDFAKQLSAFFMDRWKDGGMPMPPNTSPGEDMVFLVGGYDEGEAYGRVFEFYIPTRPDPVEQHPSDAFGLVWGGQREYTDRLIKGYDERVPTLAQQHLSLTDAQRQSLQAHLSKNLQAPIPFAFLPLQDCIDVAIFLIRTTIDLQSWLIGVRGVGGAIDVATITRTDGFQTVQLKSIRGQQ